MKKVLKNKCYLNQYVMLNLFQHLRFKRFRNKFGMTFGRAFTLAEVLITLTIIGVIAALTIPNLMQKWSDHADVAKVKEDYSILSNAFQMLYKDEGDLTEMNLTPLKLLDKLEPYLKLSKKCAGSDTSCSPYGKTNSNTYKLLTGVDGGWGCWMHENNNAAQAILANGTMISLSVNYPYGYSGIYAHPGAVGHIGQIRIDINGIKGPNRYGYDVFFFNYYNNGLSNRYAAKLFTHFEYCDISGNSNAQHLTGVSCSYWILKHGNMDYKYRDVSAEW